MQIKVKIFGGLLLAVMGAIGMLSLADMLSGERVVAGGVGVAGSFFVIWSTFRTMQSSRT